MRASLPAAALLGLAFPLQLAYGQPLLLADEAFAENLTPAELKRVYLACDRASASGLLATREAMRCSIVHEELKKRVFDGDFDLMLAWWKEEREAARDRTAPRANP